MKFITADIPLSKALYSEKDWKIGIKVVKEGKRTQPFNTKCHGKFFA